MIKINFTISSEKRIKHGVPQQTTLSPVFLNIQSNHIKSLNFKIHLIYHADNTVLVCICCSWNEVFKNVKDNS